MLINISQYENNNFLDHVNKFKQTRDLVKNKVVKELLDTFVTNQEEYRTCNKKNEQKQMKNDAF